MRGLQRVGGLAALAHTAALMIGLILSLTVMSPLLDATSDQALAFLAGHRVDRGRRLGTPTSLPTAELRESSRPGVRDRAAL